MEKNLLQKSKMGYILKPISQATNFKNDFSFVRNVLNEEIEADRGRHLTCSRGISDRLNVQGLKTFLGWSAVL